MKVSFVLSIIILFVSLIIVIVGWIRGVRKRTIAIVIIAIISGVISYRSYMWMVEISQQIDHIDKSYGIRYSDLLKDPVLSGHGFKFVTEHELSDESIVCIIPNNRIFMNMFDMAIGQPVGKLVVAEEYNPLSTYSREDVLGPNTIEIP